MRKATDVHIYTVIENVTILFHYIILFAERHVTLVMNHMYVHTELRLLWESEHLNVELTFILI